MAQGIRHKIEARIILLVMALVFTGCTTVEVPLIPVTNYIPPSSELPLINCKHSVGVSEVIFEDVREKK